MLVSLFFAVGIRAEGAPAPAPDLAAEDCGRFGTPGVVAISSSLALDFGALSRADNDSSSFSINVAPAADRFVANNLSVGGSLLFGYRTSSALYDLPSSGLDPNGPQKMLSETSASTYGISVRIGYHAWLGERFSLWPRLSIGAWAVHGTQKTLPPSFAWYRDGITLPQGDYRETALWVDAYLPLLFHPAEHFFFGFGPEFFFDV
ncbi:MAG: hypothetical protein ABW133_25710, partial [Polyangiaceae bacterium]